MVHADLDGEPVVVFWNLEYKAAVAFHTRAAGGEALTFRVHGDGFQDLETGTEWRLDGRAVRGSLDGTRLRQVNNAFVAFWGAWAAFHPGTELWEGESG